jgi:hypothetical protein
MRLPFVVVPLLEETVSRKHLPKDYPIEFWKAENHRGWIDAFMVFGSLLFYSDIPEESLPRAYAQVAYLFDWEAQCQRSGWSAFDNRHDAMDRILESYCEVGLAGEAAALKAAYQAWLGTSGSFESTSQAYDEFSHEFSIDLDRLEYLAAYFVDHADRLFYVPEA